MSHGKGHRQGLYQAGQDIYLETYIYENDATGQRIGEALKRAARRGVKDHLLIDGYGFKGLSRLLEDLEANGVQILIYRPQVSPWTLRRKRLRRTHRKIVVVDRRIAFAGGINIIDDHKPTDNQPSRYDYAVAVEGPLVDMIRLAARRSWSLVAWNNFRKSAILDSAPPPAPEPRGRMRAAFLVRDNFRHRRDIGKEDHGSRWPVYPEEQLEKAALRLTVHELAQLWSAAPDDGTQRLCPGKQPGAERTAMG